MTAPDIPTDDLTRVHPGDRIQVWDQHHLCHTGTVHQVAAHLGVLWILEDTTGIPKLFPAQDYRLRHIPVAQAA